MKAINEYHTSAKARGNTKSPKYSGRPRRPLTSYNIFFANERKKIICEQQKGQDQGGKDHAAGHGTLNLKTRTAGRRRAHVGFAGLAQYVSQKWKTVCKSYKMELEELARLDKIRYEKEMKDWRLKLKFDEDRGQLDTGDEVNSKFDESYLKIEKENMNKPTQKTEGIWDDGGSIPSICAFKNEKVRTDGMQETVSANMKESLTYFHEESPKCLVQSDYEPLPFQPNWTSCSPVPSMSAMDVAMFSHGPSSIQQILDGSFASLCHPCNTTDPSSYVLPGLSFARGKFETGVSASSSFQCFHAPCDPLDIQEQAKFTEMSKLKEYDHVRTVPVVTAASQCPLSTSMGMMVNNRSQGFSFTASLQGFDYSNDCESSLRDYSLQDIQRFFGIEPDSQEN